MAPADSWLFAQAALLGSWVFLLGVLTGIGLWCGRILRCQFSARLAETQGFTALAEAFWLGLGTTLTSLIAWNFFAPIKTPVFLIFLCAGLSGLYAHRADFGQYWKHTRAIQGARRIGLFFALWLACGLLLANRALGLPPDYPLLNPDHVLYYAESVRWAAEYPAVRGLGNLHTRLGYNQSSFLFAALLEGGFWRGLSRHVVSGLLLWAVAAQVLRGVVRVFFPSENVRAGATNLATIAAALFLPVWLDQACGRNLAAPAPDLCVFALQAFLFFALLEFLEESDSARRAERLPALLFLPAVGVSLKLSFVVFGALIAGVALLGWYFSKPPKFLTRALWLPATLAALLLVAWGARGVVLSGYPLYPNTALDFHVSWAVPKVLADTEVLSVYRSARNTDGDLATTAQSWNWLSNWAGKQVSRNQRFHTLVPLVLGLFGIGGWLALRNAPAAREHVRLHEWLAFLPVLGGLAFWFFTAPHPRFAGALFWAFAAAGFAFWLRQTRWNPTRDSRAGVGPERPLLPCLPAAVFIALALVFMPAAYKPLLLEPEQGGFQALPVYPLKTFTTRSGLKINVPDGPEGSSYTGDAPLPAAWFPQERLKLIAPNPADPQDLSSGFMLDN